MTRRLAAIALALLVTIWCLKPACAAEPAHQLLPNGLLRVISYNVQFLPGFAGIVNKRGNPQYRAKTIGEKLVAYDIIGLNELFDPQPRELLVNAMRKTWRDQLNIVVSPRVNPKRFTGGLAIISRLPILDSHVLTYSKFSTPEKYGLMADGFATKGALHARIALDVKQPGPSVDVFVTHMEAREDALRPSQYEELAAFVHEHSSSERPSLMLGDFNTQGDQGDLENASSPYNLMVGKYAAARPENQFVDLWPSLRKGEPGGTSDQLGADGGNRIDYIFLLNPKNETARLTPKTIAVNRFLDPKVTALSDHSAVEAELVCQPPSK